MNMEGQNQMCSNSTKSSKKQKQKKIPQRGLGVAQLEKIRIEEQQRRIAANAIFTFPPIVASPSNSSSLPVPLLNYPSSQSPPSITNVENLHLNSVPAPPGGGLVDGSGHLHKMLHLYELNHDLNMNIPLLNSPAISTFQMEPPSNQISHSSFSSFWPEVDKMASAKRSYPFPSSSTEEPTPKKKKNKGDGNQHGDFLTLAPPSVTYPHPRPRLMHSLSHVADSPRSVGLFSFFPASSAANNHSNSDENGEVGSTIDLNLKL